MIVNIFLNLTGYLSCDNYAASDNHKNHCDMVRVLYTKYARPFRMAIGVGLQTVTQPFANEYSVLNV